MAQAPIQFDRASGVLEGANAWERLAAVALTLGSKVASNFSHRGYNMCANLLRTTLPERHGDAVAGQTPVRCKGNRFRSHVTRRALCCAGLKSVQCG